MKCHCLVKCWTDIIFVSFAKNCKWFSGEVKVWVHIWDFRKMFKMDIQQRYWSDNLDT